MSYPYCPITSQLDELLQECSKNILPLKTRIENLNKLRDYLKDNLENIHQLEWKYGVELRDKLIEEFRNKDPRLKELIDELYPFFPIA